jgi:hypothetical protein
MSILCLCLLYIVLNKTQLFWGGAVEICKEYCPKCSTRASSKVACSYMPHFRLLFQSSRSACQLSPLVLAGGQSHLHGLESIYLNRNPISQPRVSAKKALVDVSLAQIVAVSLPVTFHMNFDLAR